MVLGGFLSSPGLYREMAAALRGRAGCRVAVADVHPRQWAAAVSARGWSRILDLLHEAVESTAQHSPGGRVVLVGHSAGGVIGRLYLSPEPFRGRRYAGLERVATLITLGSPHHNPERARLRRHVEETLPGAFFAPRVRYVSVAGRAVTGARGGTAKQRVAAWLYGHLSGNGEVEGDGLVPAASALLEGAEQHVLDGVYHAPVFGSPWYGSPEIVDRWWCEPQR